MTNAVLFRPLRPDDSRGFLLDLEESFRVKMTTRVKGISYSDLTLFDVAVGDVGSRISLRIICFNERCLKDNDVVSLKNLMTSNLWLINVRPHVSETFSQSTFD